MKHLIFLLVDHFEPREPQVMADWEREHARLADEFADADGRAPQHTWFYDEEDPQVLGALERLCRRRLGEIEVHLHHSFDTAGGLREKLEMRMRAWEPFGALVTAGPSPRRTFGFIHGKWSLDNSRGAAHCGVNNELAVLCEAGCYADFTFPAWGPMQPRRPNRIYYATDDPQRPASHRDGRDVEACRAAALGGEEIAAEGGCATPAGDLMIFMGPGRRSGVPRAVGRVPGAAWLADRLWLTCALDAHLPPWPSRVDRWAAAHVHVKGRPDWVFVKAHTHGARPENYRAWFGRHARALHSYLANRYNDGSSWRLHYATAREAYNMVKAAEAGRGGDPGAFRDFVIPPYLNRT